MRLAAGPSIKSSLSHSWVSDTRDDLTGISGTSGSYTKLSHELAGLGGDASFYKAEGETRLTRALLPGTVRYTSFLVRVSSQSNQHDHFSQHIAFSARAGSLLPLFGARSYFSDRFQFGGPTNLRMFRANSMGPRDGR
jgi:outer membrane protein insertion porin family